MDITTFLNLMVVLVPFLLITAVFSRITITELNIPAGASSTPNKPKITVEVIIRKDKLEIGDGRGVVARMSNIDGEYDTRKLSEYLVKIKNNYPDKEDATILVEPDIPYETMIKVMDAVRALEQGEGEEKQKIALFPDMGLGEAP